jgi:secernin
MDAISNGLSMCDCLVSLPPASATTLFAKASDRPPSEAQRLEWHPGRADDAPTMATYVEVDCPADRRVLGVVGSRPWWGWGYEHGVNEAGVAAGNATIYTTLDPRSEADALTGMDLVRLILERADSAEAAVGVLLDLLDRYGQGGSGHHGAHRPYWNAFLVADPTSAFVVETSGRESEVERVSRTRATSNRTTIASFDRDHRHPRQPVSTLVDSRLRCSEAVLAAEPVTVDRLRQHLRSHDGVDGYSVCMHVPSVEATRAALIAVLTDEGRPLVHVAAGSPCASVFVPLYVGRPLGEPVAWERFAALSPEHRVHLDQLEAELVVEVVDDDRWADEAWRRVDKVLSGLGV